MATLNLNFHKQTGRHNPTKHELTQIESVAFSIEAIIKTLNEYAINGHEDIGSVCMGVCYGLELLIAPVTDYMANYAGDTPAPEEAEKTA